MKSLPKLKKQIEIDFLKTKSYEEINEMFNQLNDKLKTAEKEIEKFHLRGFPKKQTYNFESIEEAEDRIKKGDDGWG